MRPILHRRPRNLVLSLGGLALAFLATLYVPVSATLLDGSSINSTRITAADGTLLREVRPAGRGAPIRVDDLQPEVISALVAVEDRYFYRHPGVNPFAIVRAAFGNLSSGGVHSGGSTITMQVARSLRARQSRNLADKLAEVHLALRLERQFSKKEILALWLGRVPFGNQAHGLESAAQVYFGKAARDLTLAEATYLIGLPQSPSRYDPFRNPDRAAARHGRVLAAMERHGAISNEERIHLSGLSVAVQQPRIAFHAPHFVEWIRTQHRNDLPGYSEIRTTVDAELQQSVETLLRGHVRHLTQQGVTNAAAVVLDNRSGAILAYAGSADFWNQRHSGQVDGVRMLRQPGSTLKPFTYAVALASRNYTPASILPDVELSVPEAGGAFSPQNYDRRFRGPVSAREALAGSYNVPAVRLAREIGPAALLVAYRQAGFHSLNRDPDFYGVGLTLGNGEVSLLELGRAYAGLARGGSLPAVRPVQWVRTLSNDTVAAPVAPPEVNGIDPAVAFLITDMLRDPEARAPAFGRGGALELPFPTAVKTGTSKDYRDNWAVGYTPTHTVAVWTGNFDGRPMQWVSGVSGAAPLLKAIFLQIGSGGDFEQPAGLQTAVLCPASGLRPGASCPARRNEILLAGTTPNDTCTVHQRRVIDRRTGLLADEATPRADRSTELFIVHPPLYHAWMRANHIPLPPEFSASEIEARAVSRPDTVIYSDLLTVQYPESGMVFTLDPVLRPEYQQIHLKGATAEALFDVHWNVNGARLDGTLQSARLALAPGRHAIELRGIGRDGWLLRSRPVVIMVR